MTQDGTNSVAYNRKEDATIPSEGYRLSVRPDEARAHVLGGECCLWSEYIRNEYDLAWRAWPRTCAAAEILWSNPAPRDYADFRRRMDAHRPRLLRRLINCAPME